MSAPGRVRLLSDLAVGDTVATPSKRYALVTGFEGSFVKLRYLDDADEVEIAPHLLTLIARAKPHAFPRGFFKNVTAVRA